ncbi:MAG: CDP-archaeol synthase [Promethearchaeota archaeon]
MLKKIASDDNISEKEWKTFKVFTLLFVVLFTSFFMYWVVVYTVYDFLCLLGLTFWGLFPCYLSNAGMVITGGFKELKKYPIDGGRKLRDGNRVLGEGKTWNGMFGGIFFGFFGTVALYPLVAWVSDVTITCFLEVNRGGQDTLMQFFDLESILYFLNAGSNFHLFMLRALLLSIGAPVGDLLGSFVKRRFGKSDGGQFLILDQLDFILVSALLVWPVYPFPWYSIACICLFTPLLTILANFIAYYLDRKPYPW